MTKRSPDNVPVITGKKVTIAIRTILGVGPSPSQSRSKGAMAIFGAVCSNRISGVASRSATGSRANTSAQSTPASNPTTKPQKISISVT